MSRRVRGGVGRGGDPERPVRAAEGGDFHAAVPVVGAAALTAATAAV